jgi:Raf kinase inhibitor-like YbhB/YbcL family protein
MAMKISSTVFREGDTIPKPYTGDGKNISPPLSWQNVPAGTQSFALICDDPDAPRSTWVHWVLFNLPAETQGLAEGIAPQKELGDGAKQGTNDFGKIGFGGPAPPRGNAHRYFFKLYALDSMLNLPGGATRDQVVGAMRGHILGEGQTMGKYAR